jgi:hypothetical protein
VRFNLSGLIILSGVIVAGCDRDDQSIRFYSAPKENAQALRWKVPPGWKQLPARQMRFATFAVNEGNPPVELTVIPLGPEAGNIPANVNRWEGQLGLPPSPPEQLEKIVKKVQTHGLEISTVDLSDAAGKQRMLAAILSQSGRVWFFKMVGPADVVGGQKENFDAFMNSLEPGGAEGTAAGVGPAPQAQGAGLPPGHPKVMETKGLAIRHFSAPDDWHQQTGVQPPRILVFKIGTGETAPELVVTRFTSGAGGLLENINRWRAQIGLAPLADTQNVEVTHVPIGKDQRGVLLEINNPGANGKPARSLMVVIDEHPQDTWFFKLIGPADLVAAQKPAFISFMKSVEFGSAPEENAVEPRN